MGERPAARIRRLGLLGPGPLGGLLRRPASELVQQLQISPSAARRLRAAAALGRVLAGEGRGRALRRPGQVAELWRRYLAPGLEGLEQEEFHAVLLDARHRPLSLERISVGTLTASLVHPREVFRSAVRQAAAALVVAHNHPSGDPEPSQEDLTLTRRLVAAGELLGIPLLDHVVIGDGSWVSLRSRMDF